MDNVLHTKFGTAKIGNNGYYKITSAKEGNNMNYLHRLIFEDHWKCSLLQGTVIHHIDGNKTNNDIHNLKLMSQREHNLLHRTGKKHSPNTRAKISKSHKGKKLSYETRKKLSESKKGKNHPMYGKKQSLETRAKRSESLKGDKNPRWGMSIVDEWGGLWFLKEMKKQVGTLQKLHEYTGITSGSITGYLERRGLKWSEI